MRKEQEIDDIEIIDGHTHASGIEAFNFFTPRLPSSQSIAELEAKMVRSGVAFAVVFPMPSTLYYNPRILLSDDTLQPSGLEDFPYEVENRALMYEVSVSLGHFLPFLAIDPKEEVEKQVRFLREQKEYFGLKFHPVATHSSIDDLKGSLFLDILQERGIPLMVHSGRQRNALPESIFSFAQEHPGIKFCIAHLAGFDAEIISRAKKLDNIFFDTSPFLNCCFLAGQKNVFSITGDGAYLHSGKNSIAEAIKRDLPVKIIVICNGGSQGTGGQIIPGDLYYQPKNVDVFKLNYKKSDKLDFKMILEKMVAFNSVSVLYVQM